MTSSKKGNKGLQHVNNPLKAANQGDVNGFSGNGPGSQDDDELRTSKVEEHVQDGCNQVAVPPQQLPQGSLAHWETFLHVRSIKVMLVENDDCTRHVVTALLRNCNYEVIEAANGFQAWKILEDLSNHIDLVLSEVVMPSFSGIGLLCKIMSHKTRKNVPVIMMSSHDSMGLVFKCLSKGAVDFLVKPIRKNELKNLWQHVWRRCHSSSGSGSESGTQAQKSVNSKSNLRYDNSGSKEEDDYESTDGGSGTQSSWTKQAVECESPETASPCDSTCGLVIRPTMGPNDHEQKPFTDDGGNTNTKEIAVQIEVPIKHNVADSKMLENHMENEDIKCQEEPKKTVDNTNNKINDDINGLTAGKRPRETENEEREVQNGCNILRHSELSAFTRYKTNTNATHSQHDIIVKKESKRDAHSDGYLIYQGSTKQVVPRKGDDVAPQEVQIQHIHHYHHVHHYHDMDTEQPVSNEDEFGPNDLGADAPHCGSSNNMGGPAHGPVEGKIENYSLNGSGSGSKHGSNVPNGSNGNGGGGVNNVESNADVVQGKSGGGGGGGDAGGKSALREAALTKFRQKREVRCFQKKVRYQNRKKLAEQRPRVRGQFVKGTSRDSSANAAADG